MLILSLAMALLASDPDGVVATARATPLALDATAAPVTPAVDPAGVQAAAHGLTTDQQIDRWIADRSPDAEPFTSDVGVATDDREVHGYVEAGIGTGGYHSYGGGVSLPIGAEGRLDLRYHQVENDRVYGHPGYGYGWPGHGYAPFEARGERETSFSAGARWDRETRSADGRF